MEHESDRAKILAPPPILAGLCLGVGVFFEHLIPIVQIPDVGFFRIVLSLCLFTIGGAILFISLRTLHFYKTSPNPYQSTVALASTGIYHRTRNPLYVHFFSS